MGHKKLVHGAGTNWSELVRGRYGHEILLCFIQIGFPRTLENEITYQYFLVRWYKLFFGKNIIL